MTRFRGFIGLAISVIASLVLGSSRAEVVTANPFAGVVHTYRTETSPRRLRMHIIQIDLAAPGLHFLVTPQSGPRDTANQTTIQFLIAHEAQIAINSHFFKPWPADGTGYSWLTGLAASATTSGPNGHAYAPFERNLGYPYQNDLPALNIGPDNSTDVVYQADGDSTGYATHPQVALYNAVCGNEQILTRGVNTAGTGSWDNTLNPRTVIGIASTGDLVLFTVDGRQPGVSEGMTTGEVADLLRSDYGVTDAINLDGGGSTTLVMADPTPRVVNVPVGIGDVPGSERSVGSNLAVFAAPPECSADVDCSGPHGPCREGACDRGVCRAIPNPDGSPCDDGDACTDGDACGGGTCIAGPPSCTIEGTVFYYRDSSGEGFEPSGKPVSSVGIDMSGDSAARRTTDTNGSYAFVQLAGSFSVRTVPKLGHPRAADHNDAITSFDAAMISRRAVGLIELTPAQDIAADVSGDGGISAYDAALVSQFAVQLIDHFPVATSTNSDWKFSRCDSYPSCTEPSYSHTPLAGVAADDFHAILYGDVSGNWTSASTSIVLGDRGDDEEADAGTRDRVEAARLHERRTPLRPSGAALLSVRGWPASTRAGTRYLVTLDIDNADGIVALDLELAFDRNRLSIVDVRTAGVASACRLAASDKQGRYRIALYGTESLRGSGGLLEVTLEATASIRRPAFTVRAQANEGNIGLRIVPRTAMHDR